VNIPPGVDTGTRLRVSGEGEGGYKGGPKGDLYVEIRVRDHDFFERREEDLIGILPVDYLQLLLGAEVEAPTVMGKQKLQIPHGTQPGDTLKLNGEGLPTLRGSRRGDIYYQIKVELPQKISKEEEKLLKEIAKIRGISAGSEGFSLFGKRK